MADTVNTKRNLTLNWTTPTRIMDFVIPDQSEKPRGVYLWGFTIHDQFIPYYVGIAEDIIARIYKHVRCIISGEYTIYHQNSLATFYDYKDKDARADQQGKLYEPNVGAGFNVFLQQRKQLQPHIDYMVDTFTFLYAVAGKDITDQNLKDIEKGCIAHIGKDILANTRMGSSCNFDITHTGLKEWISK